MEYSGWPFSEKVPLTRTLAPAAMAWALARASSTALVSPSLLMSASSCRKATMRWTKLAPFSRAVSKDPAGVVAKPGRILVQNQHGERIGNAVALDLGQLR